MDFLKQKCLSVDASSQACMYMMGLAQVAVGGFYDGIKSTTKVSAGMLCGLFGNIVHLVKSHSFSSL